MNECRALSQYFSKIIFLKFHFRTETLGALKTHLTGTGGEEKLEMYFLKNLDDISINQETFCTIMRL